MNGMFWMAALLLGLALGTTALAADAAKAKPASPLAKVLTTPILEKGVSHGQMRALLHTSIPPLKVPATAKAWDAQARELRQRMLDEVVLKGHDPDVLSAKTKIEWHDTIETGRGYRIRKLRYEAYPGMWVPALLYEPAELTGKVPVVLNPNGHERPAGKAVKYKQIRCINQAKRGMIALNPEWLAMGELRLAGYDHYELAYLDLCGQSGVGVFYMLLKRGLDVLLDHPNADPSRTAVTGLSGGGWQTIFFASLDTRVKLAVPNAGYIGQHTRFEHRSDIGDLEQCPVDQMLVADYTHMTAMLAPRPALLIYNKMDNCCFVSERARPSVYDPIVPFYELCGKADRFRYHENADPGNHNYELDNRQQLYKFINAQFLPAEERRDDEIPSDKEVLTRKQLSVGVPKDNATFYTLAERAMADLPRHPLAERNGTPVPESWHDARRAALRSVLRLPESTAPCTAVKTKRIAGDAYTASAVTLEINATWHVPTVVLSRKGARPKRVAVVVGDGGRASTEGLVADLVSDGHRVVAADLLLTGECRPVGLAPWQVAMCMGNVGARPLGLKVAQLIGLMDYAAKTYPDCPITLAGVGRVSSVTTVLAAALAEEHRSAMLVTVGLPASLKLLIEKRAKYTDVPSLFCFGLLAEADVCEMLALTLPAHVQLIKTEGGKKRIAEALGGFARASAHAGHRAIDLHQQGYGD